MPVEHGLYLQKRERELGLARKWCCASRLNAHAYHTRHIHILGSVQNIKIARDAIVSLILGSPPGMLEVHHGCSKRLFLSMLKYSYSIGKVYAHLKTVGARMKQRF